LFWNFPNLFHLSLVCTAGRHHGTGITSTQFNVRVVIPTEHLTEKIKNKTMIGVWTK